MRKRTSNNYTYNMGSHVMQFGALSIDEEPAADYLGELNTGGATQAMSRPPRRRLSDFLMTGRVISELVCLGPLHGETSLSSHLCHCLHHCALHVTFTATCKSHECIAGITGADNDLFAEGGMGAVDQRDADLLHLWTAYSRAGTPSEKAAALAALHAEVDKRDRVDSAIRSSVWALLQQPAVLAQLQVLALVTPYRVAIWMHLPFE